MYINFPRPEEVFTFGPLGAPNIRSTHQSEGDWYWGNRWEVGYNTAEDHGWLMNVMHIQGLFIESEGRLNDTQFWNVDLNKTYRMEFNEGYFEPFFGIRYMYLRDHVRDFLDDTAVEFQEIKNSIIGGQIGARYYKQKGRWNLSGSARGFAGQNYQNLYLRDTAIILDPDDPMDPQPIGTAPVRGEADFDEFVPMVEFRLDASYHFTRDLALNVGFEAMYFARGLVRSNPEPPTFISDDPTDPDTPNMGTFNFPMINDRDMSLVGITLGIVWNR
jgi:hypothetical protein